MKASIPAFYMGDPSMHDLVVDVPEGVASFDAIWIDAINPTSENVGCVGSITAVP
jgi:hypothetical protein